MISAISMQPRCGSGGLPDKSLERFRTLATLKGLVQAADEGQPATTETARSPLNGGCGINGAVLAMRRAMVSERVTKVFAVVGALGVTGLVVGGLVVALSIHHGFSARDKPSWLEAKLARAMRSWAVPGRAKRLANPVSATPETLTEARAHWADHCASCHANNGSGDTTLGRNLYPKAPDMQTAPTQGLSDGELYYIIQNGIRLSGMPAWGQAVDDDRDSWGLVLFIRHLPKLTHDELEEMKKLNPSSSHEWHEEQEEERFLQGDEPAGSDEDTKPSHHD